MDTEQLSMTKKTLTQECSFCLWLSVQRFCASSRHRAGNDSLHPWCEPFFSLCHQGKVPIFLGSSFAFIAPIIAATKQWGLPGTIAGLTSVSLVYFAMGAW